MTTFIDRVRLAVKVYRSGIPRRYQSKVAPMVWPDFRVGKPEWHLVDLEAYIREGFNMNTLIYSAIMYKAKALSSVPLRAYTGDLDQPEPLPDSAPLAKLCARPNTSQSWREFQMLQTVWLNLTGNAFTYFERKNRGEAPTAMVALNPLRIYIVPGTRGTIKGYLYVPEGASQQDGIPFLPEDVSHVKLPNPGDPLDGDGYGLSPLSALAYSADVDNDITKFLKVFFEKGTMVGGILKFQTPMDDLTIARVKERWAEIYGGYENFGEIGVLDQQGEYQRISMTFDEMGFETLDERNESRILGPFGVPPQLIYARIGMKHSTYNNWGEAYDAFWNDTLLHEARLFEDDYQYFLSDGNTFVAFDFSDVPAFQQDVPAMVLAWRGLVEYGIPKNMAADTVGLSLGKLPDGDVSYMPLSLVPIEQAQGQRDANAAAAEVIQEPEPEPEPEEETDTPQNVTEDDRQDESKALDVKKKPPGHLNKKRRSGNHMTQLVGVGNASSRLARKKALNTTSENY